GPGAGGKRRVEAARHLRAGLSAGGVRVGRSSKQLVPAILGSDERAIRVATALREAGFLGLPIRPPTVPEGTSRIRLSASAHHQLAEIDRLVDALVAAL